MEEVVEAAERSEPRWMEAYRWESPETEAGYSPVSPCHPAQSGPGLDLRPKILPERRRPIRRPDE